MRLSRPLSIVAVLNLLACGGSSDSGDTEPAFASEVDVGALGIDFYAVIIDDSEQFPEHRDGDLCATSSIGAHGADIDAVELHNSDTSLWVTGVNYAPGTSCDIDATHADTETIKGPPDATLTENFLSLGGGSVTVTFSERIVIEAGWIVTVYEVGDSFCGSNPLCVGDEAFSVFLTTELACTRSSTDCTVVQIADQAGGEVDIDVPAF